MEGLAGFGGFGAFGGFGGFGEFWRVCGLANGSFESLRKPALKAHRKPLLWPGPGVPVGEVALALGCMLGKVFGILEVWILCRLAHCSFEAHRKSLLWPWPPVKEGVWNFRGVAAFAGWQTAALRPIESHC